MSGRINGNDEIWCHTSHDSDVAAVMAMQIWQHRRDGQGCKRERTNLTTTVVEVDCGVDVRPGRSSDKNESEKAGQGRVYK